VEGRFVLDDRPIPYRAGDTVAVAILRAGEHPTQGGTVCLAGDCGNCVAEVDGVAYVRTCQTPARPGLVVQRHPAHGHPPLRGAGRAGLTNPSPRLRVERADVDVVVIGGGDSGIRAAAEARAAGRVVELIDAGDGSEAVAIYAGPTVIVRTPQGMLHLTCGEVVVAAGAAELQPVCAGNDLKGLMTVRAAIQLHAAGVDLGVAVAIGEPPTKVPCMPLAGRLLRIEGTERVSGVVTRDGEGGEERATPCDTVIVGLGYAARDPLARMAADLPVSLVGAAAKAFPLPPAPTAGTICHCSGVTVKDVEDVWERGFRHLELVKRASLCGTGTCQGAACLPHLRALLAERSTGIPTPFTARPAVRQITIAEAAAGVYVDAFRRTPLHGEHVRLGARMDRFGGWWRPWHYGDHVAEYWAVREAVSLGDVSTLGKLLVSGPDVVEALERLYPTNIADLRVGRSRYALLLNERGHVIDDGMICREGPERFVLTFTSAGAGHAEAWVRDWIETWGLRVHVLDRTNSLAAINVTGPLASELLGRVGLDPSPRFLQHVHAAICGVPCHVMRLSFTGEASFELHHSIDRSVELWRALMSQGRDLGIAPHGLQAQQGLRLEKGHIIIGMDSDLDSTPRRLGMEWAVKMDKPDFVGRGALARIAGLSDQRRLVGLTTPGPAPTEGSPIWSQGELLGHVTSSFDSPLLGHAVMLGWLKPAPYPDQVKVDGRIASVVAPPFYDAEGDRARA